MKAGVRVFATMTSALVLAVCSATSASAQQPPVRSEGELRTFDIPAGDLASALNRWSAKTGTSVIFRTDDVSGSRSPGVKGRMTDNDALDRILQDTNFAQVRATGGGIAIVTRASDAAGLNTNAGNVTPDILVTGRSGWTLNAGVERTQDDSQPFIVLDRDEIRRSGAPNLETFLRDRLNVNASPQASDQAATADRGSASRGTSSINLRGLGVRDTLILVDGRRQPGINLGDGTIGQAQITGIPLAAIERIEVLASSASGLYGSGASGGVINIVLRRDFSGGEISASYGNTTDFAQGQGQVDITYGMPLEGGRTRLAVTGSWRKANPLLFKDRFELRDDGVAQLLANNPNALSGVTPPLGNQVNYSGSSSDPLVLKPQFGGTTLPTSFGSIPAGYRGVAIDGIAPLIGRNGQYNLEPVDAASPGGLRYPLTFGSEQWNGSVTFRRTFSDSLTAYFGSTYSRSTSTTLAVLMPLNIGLAENAPNNPFTTDLTIALPGVGREANVTNRQQGLSFIGGATVKLPLEWQAALDLSWSRNRFVSDRTPPRATEASVDSLVFGQQDVLRDLTLFPPTLTYDNVPFSTANTPALSTVFTPALRLAGPLPFRLPGGKPQVSLSVEHRRESLGSVINADLRDTFSRVDFMPGRTQTTRAAYAEIAFPLLGEGRTLPLFQQFELRFAARWENYVGDGSQSLRCTVGNTVITENNLASLCSSVAGDAVREETRNSRTDPSVSVRWVPFNHIVLRGSYTTGYLPPRLDQLNRIATSTFLLSLRDPLRGPEPLFANGQISGFYGGNPNVLPESSKTITAGIIVTPPFVPGLRFSADWTRIRKRNVYFDPLFLGFGGPASQQAFNLLLAAYPDRAVRAAPSDGFSVGRITSLDLSLVNLLGLSTDAIDFVLDYNRDLFGGSLNLVSRATYVDKLSVESFPGAPAIDYAGVVDGGFGVGAGANGSLRFRGNVAVNWTKDAFTLGWQTRYFSRYYLNTARTVDVSQGSPFVASQTYHDLNVTYRTDVGATVSLSINNLFNKRPPLDATAQPFYYSRYGDPRLRNFLLTVNKTF